MCICIGLCARVAVSVCVEMRVCLGLWVYVGLGDVSGCRTYLGVGLCPCFDVNTRNNILTIYTDAVITCM